MSSEFEAPAAEVVAAALRENVDGLDGLDGAELSEHVDLYQRVHRELQGALSDIDDA